MYIFTNNVIFEFCLKINLQFFKEGLDIHMHDMRMDSDIVTPRVQILLYIQVEKNEFQSE